MPKLEEDHTAFVMHGIDGVLPALGHLVRVDARRLIPAICFLGDRGRLRDQQARLTALSVSIQPSTDLECVPSRPVSGSSEPTQSGSAA